MNASQLTREAVIEFSSPDYVIIQPGDHVRCAVTGTKIPIKEMKYWDPNTQEAYVSAEAATRAWLKHNTKAS